MKDFDFEKFDGQFLKIFFLILEENFVLMVVECLDVNQLMVSYFLNKLCRILGDLLFVCFGQGLMLIEMVLVFKVLVFEVLDKFQLFMDLCFFDFKFEKMYFVVVVNDMQCDLIFLYLLRQVWVDKIVLIMELCFLGVLSVGFLCDVRCDLILIFLFLDVLDFMQFKFFIGEMYVFYDFVCCDVLKFLDDYVQLDYVFVYFVFGGLLDEVIVLWDL